MAFSAFLDRAWDKMETAWRRAIELQHDHVLALGSFALTLCGRQRLAEALPLFARAKEADPLASFPYMIAGWGLLVSGKLEEALREIDDAFDVLARAEEEHRCLLCYTGMPGFDPLRSDARFAALLRRLGLAPA